MDRLQYLLLMGACVLVTLPLELVLGVRVWRSPRRLLRSLLPAFALFVAWDLWATGTGTWGFSPSATRSASRCPAAWRSRSWCSSPSSRSAGCSPSRRSVASSGGGRPSLMPIYPILAVSAAVAVVVVELALLRTGLFRDRAYWIAMAICFAFMIPVDGWLTKQSAPIVLYRRTTRAASRRSGTSRSRSTSTPSRCSPR